MVLPSKVMDDCCPKVLCNINCFLSVSLQFYIVLRRCLLNVHMLMTWHFSGWNLICHLISHSLSASRSRCSALASLLHLICLYNNESSANNLVSDGEHSGKSLIKNSCGPKTVPCGTPNTTLECGDGVPSSKIPVA